MKKVFLTFFLSLLTAHCLHAESSRSRNVYVWDVTASINDNMYKSMIDYLFKDIENQRRGIEIVIIPFNDFACKDDIIKFTIGDESYTTQNSNGTWAMTSDFKSQIRSKGNSLIQKHSETYHKNKNSDTTIGYTNIASSLRYAKENYLKDDVHTNFILLTDGDQEYYRGDNKALNYGNDETREYLYETIREWDDKAKGIETSDNWLYYVISAQGVTDPRKGHEGEEFNNVSFINADEFSKGYARYRLEVKEEVVETTSRDKSFTIAFVQDYALAASIDDLKKSVGDEGNISIEVKGEGINHRANLDLKNFMITVPCKFLPNEEKEVELTLSISNAEYLDKTGRVKVKLKPEKITLRVVNTFKPKITISIID